MKYFNCYKPHQLLGPHALVRGISHTSSVWNCWCKEVKKLGNEGWQLAASPILRTTAVFSPFASNRTERRSENSLTVTSVPFLHVTPVLYIMRSTAVITSSSRARSLWGRLKHPASSYFRDSYSGRPSQC